MHELKRTDYERVRPLFRKLEIHLPLQAILAGNVDAPIFVDNPLRPQTALTWTGHRFYVAGAPGNSDFVAEARKIFLEQYVMQAWKAGFESYILHYPSPKWETILGVMLTKKYPIKSLRSYYALKANRVDWKSALPADFHVRTVDANLLAEKWQNPEFLTEEMCSERVSVADFLAKSFGVCLTHQDQIVGWCLSEYNTGHRCEVGIATHEDYQLRGFSTLLASAFIDLARTRDVAKIGWHCSAANLGSASTALKAGFEKVEDYPVYIGWPIFQPMVILRMGAANMLKRWPFTRKPSPSAKFPTGLFGVPPVRRPCSASKTKPCTTSKKRSSVVLIISINCSTQNI